MSIKEPKYKDYYELLGLSREDITADKVKKAFMVKAMKWHPDKAPNEEAVKIYTRVYEDLQQAYKILSNEDSRRMYSDTQQTTNHDLVRQERDLSYDQVEERYRLHDTKGSRFNHKAFLDDFNQTRTKEDLKLISEAEKNNRPVTTGDIEQYMAARDNDVVITNVFRDTSFNTNVFNQVFEYNKIHQPAQGLEEYRGDPVAMGLAEIEYAGIHTSLMNLSERACLDVGVSLNPRSIDFKMFEDQAPRATVKNPLTNREIEESIKRIQADRLKLAGMTHEEFSKDTPEITKLYQDVLKRQ